MPTIFITATGTFSVPADCESAQINVIGAGSNGGDGTSAPLGGNGGIGGCFARANSVTLTPGQTAWVQVPSGNSASTCWFNKASNAAPGSVTNGALASSQSTSTASCIGDVVRGGGAGGTGQSGFGGSGGGGGGAGGPSAAGNSGANGDFVGGGNGGAGDGGSGGSAGVGDTTGSGGGAGGAGAQFTQTSPSLSGGSGGGGGGGQSGGSRSGGAGGNYGAGGGGGSNDGGIGGVGRQGFIAFVYTAVSGRQDPVTAYQAVSRAANW